MGTVSQYNMANVHGCFGWGYDMNSYRGRQYWRDDGSTGYFSSGQINMTDFLGTRPDNPVTGPSPYPLTDAILCSFDGSGFYGGGILFGRFVGGIIANGSSMNLAYADGGIHHGALQYSVDGVVGVTEMAWNGALWTASCPFVLAGSVRTVRFYAPNNV